MYVYLELADSTVAVWCAESPDVPGFYAAHDYLPTLLSRVEDALADIASEGGDDGSSVRIVWELIGGPSTSAPELAALGPHNDIELAVGAHVVSDSKSVATAA